MIIFGSSVSLLDLLAHRPNGLDSYIAIMDKYQHVGGSAEVAFTTLCCDLDKPFRVSRLKGGIDGYLDKLEMTYMYLQTEHQESYDEKHKYRHLMKLLREGDIEKETYLAAATACPVNAPRPYNKLVRWLREHHAVVTQYNKSSNTR